MIEYRSMRDLQAARRLSGPRVEECFGQVAVGFGGPGWEIGSIKEFDG